MDHFNFRNSRLFAEQVPVMAIAEKVGTPCYIYSRATLERHWHAFDRAFGDYPHQIHYAVKANGNLAVLNLFARLGSGFDIVSGGELYRVIAAGGDPAKTIFSGVCKQEWEIRVALEAGVEAFNIESESELELIKRVADELKVKARIAVRINPDVDPLTHPYISTGLKCNKFGLSQEQAFEIYMQADSMPSIDVYGVACHIGSQILELSPYKHTLEKVLSFIERLKLAGIRIGQIDFGGGLGVRYADELPPQPAEYVALIREQLENYVKKQHCRIAIAIEPGRAIVGNAGILLTRVCGIKHNEKTSFCIIDAAMNDLIRPALYQAYQEIIEENQNSECESGIYDVVGPVCESGDFIGKKRTLRVSSGDLLAVRTVGAYGAVMSSNYNSRPRSAEVMVDGKNFYIIRERENPKSLFKDESLIPFE